MSIKKLCATIALAIALVFALSVSLTSCKSVEVNGDIIGTWTGAINGKPITVKMNSKNCTYSYDGNTGSLTYTSWDGTTAVTYMGTSTLIDANTLKAIGSNYSPFPGQEITYKKVP